MEILPHVLLEILVREPSPEAMAAVLHCDVVLVRADDTRVAGRAAVLAMFATDDDGIRYRVVASRDGVVIVAMSVPGVPGSLGFTLRGVVTDGVLCEVRVDVPGSALTEPREGTR